MKKYSVLGSLVLSLLIASHSSAYALIDLNVGGGASSSGSVNVEVNSTATSSTGNSSQASSETSGSIEANQAVIISRSTLEVGSAASVETSHEAVLTQGDLRAYATTALRSDENLEGMNFTGDRVEVSYKERGKLLAIMPIAFTAKAVAKADGSVELDYPWYAFLTLDNEEQIKTDLKIAVDNALKARTVGSVRAEGEVESPKFTASESAEVAAEMHTVLRSSLESQAERN